MLNLKSKKTVQLKTAIQLLLILKALRMALHLTAVKVKTYPLEIGSNAFIPGFEEQLIGMKN